MWASQPEARNKNMTSLKNKITHRKRKNSKSKSSNAQSTDDNVNVNSVNHKNTTTKKAQKPSESTRSVGVNRKNSNLGQKPSNVGTTESNKSIAKSGEKIGAEPDLIENLKSQTDCKLTHNSYDVTELTNGAVDIRHGCPTTDVQVRNENLPTDFITHDCDLNSDEVDHIHGNNANNKRYSDSFVISCNDTKANFDRKNTNIDNRFARANSEIFVNGRSGCESRNEKSERKSRRFSDIFRYGGLKPARSCDNIKAQMKMNQPYGSCQEEPSEDCNGVILRRKDQFSPTDKDKRQAVFDMTNKKNKKGVVRVDSKNLHRDSVVNVTRKPSLTKNSSAADISNAKKKEETPPVLDNNESYLKRVKSKIYKNKSDNGNVLPSMPNISENTKSKKNKKKKGGSDPPKPEDFSGARPELKKSVSQFDFRLIRQTSNLERIRPKTFGLRSSSNMGIADLVDHTAHILNVSMEKPVLAKSKSSSAINLNLLRTRRNKLLEQAKKNCKVVHEFDFIAFGGVNTSVQLTRKFGSQNLINGLNNNVDIKSEEITGETKPGHPVSRTSSDRRPDAVREESRTQESQDHNDHEAETTHQDSTVSLPAYTGKKKPATNINRSESVKEQSEKRKQRRNISDPLHNTTNETVDLEQQGLTFHTNSGSSSNSSLSSSRSSESPSTSLDAVSGFPGSHPGDSGWDSDMELEADPPDWQSSVPEDVLASLHPNEKKRQDVINELFHTERSHVRNLRVLDYIFKRPLLSSKLLKHDDINLVFPNLSELLDIHVHYNTTMKSKRKENPVVRDIGDVVVTMFDGTMGDNFQSAAAAFCERQQLALEFIKERRKKDSRLDNFLNECEKNNLCRRLPLQGILPTEMQRLSKYPLLLERLIDSVEKTKEKDPEYAHAELNKLKQAHDRSKEILNHVNEAAKIAFNRARLEDIQKHLDTSLFERTDHAIVNEFKNLDLTRYKLVQEGTMHLRRSNKQPVPVHIVLLEEAVILLQRDAEKYVLKFFQVGTPTQQPLAPIIKTSTLLVRTNAALKSSLYLVNTSTQNSQMYDLLARDPADRDIWFKHISDAAEAYNRREGKSKRSDPTPDAEDTETVQELPSAKEATAERSEHVGVGETATCEDAYSGATSSGDGSNRDSGVMEDDRDKTLSQSDSEETGGGNGLTLKLAAEDWPLVQPSEVHVAVPPVHNAEPVFTPLEQIRRKDQEVRRALADKEGLVADLLSIPREDYQLIADIASEEAHIKGVSEREPSELVLAAVYQADQLLAAVSDCLNISEADAVLATGGKHASCSSNEAAVTKQTNHIPSVPVHQLLEIATTLSTQLTTLLSVIKQRDEERDRLRKELHRTREQLHEKLTLHGTQSDADNASALDPTQSGDLESIEESPTE